MKKRLFTIIFSFCLLVTDAQSDSLAYKTDNKPSNHKKLFIAGGSAVYAAFATGLYFSWYNQYDQTRFHFFNDWHEWEQMDKAGHLFSSYFQSDLIFNTAIRAGYSSDASLALGAFSSLLFQSTIEVMDGFSSGWGFSVFDFSSNLVGTSIFAIQEKLWEEQRVKFKVSYWPVNHNDDIFYSENGLLSTSNKQRADALFGFHSLERLLKDYNGQTVWLSANINSFFKQSVLPDWINIAFGYSSHNMYGGFINSWGANDELFIVDSNKYPRHRQYILALDYDLSKVKTSNVFFKTLFDVLNIFKWPSPAIEYTSNGKMNFHLVFLN